MVQTSGDGAAHDAKRGAAVENLDGDVDPGLRRDDGCAGERMVASSHVDAKNLPLTLALSP